MEYGSCYDELEKEKWDFAFIGIGSEQRDITAIEALNGSVSNISSILYQPNDCALLVNEKFNLGVDDVEAYLEDLGISENSKIILECTSLGFAEILVLMQALKNLNCKGVDALYLAPGHYARQHPDIYNRRNFDLTTSFAGFKAIPGQALAYNYGDKAIVLCGYEAERLSRAFDETELQGKDCQLIFGVPPYVVGWDMNSYTNYISVIESNYVSREFYYCGAANPLSVYEKMEKVYKGLGEEQKLFVLPFGTKPMALGACAFIVEHNCKHKLSILFDHPQKKKERSYDIGTWNLYRIIYG